MNFTNTFGLGKGAEMIVSGITVHENPEMLEGTEPLLITIIS